MTGVPIRRLRRLHRDTSAAMAVEFAITGTAFLSVVLFVFALGFRMYVQVALDYAAARAARMLAVDSSQHLSANTQQFQTISLCPLLAAFLSCGGIVVSLQPVTTYANGSGIGPGTPPFNPGQSGSLELLQLGYTLPSLTWPLPGGGSGGFPSASVSAGYPYQNEY